MRVVIHRRARGKSFLRSTVWIGLGVFLLLVVAAASILTYYYVGYSRMIEERLQGPVFPNVSQIYAAPEKLQLGDPASAAGLIAHLRTAGFGDRRDTPRGRYQALRNGVRIYPGPDSYFSGEPAELHFTDGKLSSIVSLRDQFARSEYSLEPQLITNLFDSSREKRRLVKFGDLPKNLVNAVLAIEDRRFFEHSGFDYLRLMRAAYVDITQGSFRQGASTISQQLARSLFLTADKTISRKLAEAMVTFQLERRLSKEEIFENYANITYLGARGSFRIRGFGEGAQVYFRKDVRDLTLPEAAFLAGSIQSPARYSPYRHPEAALRRRTLVLNAMVETAAITPAERDEAAKAPLGVAPSYAGATEAPYFIDLVKDQLLDRFSEEELTSESYRVYTTLDLRLQRAAAEAVRIGVEELDKRLDSLRRPRSRAAQDPDAPAPVRPEIALVALDPRTGAIKALIGGRDYGASQLNRALALRQPGSVFKPFVYAAALTAYQNGSSEQAWTPISKVLDEPTTFEFGNQPPYQPANFGNDYFGEVTLRYALRHSLNIATIKIAESVGYDTVVSLAHRAGLNEKIMPTPAVALGAYEVTPVEVAGSYTIFANHGVRLNPYFLSMVRSRNGLLLDIAFPRKTPVLAPAVAYLMTNLMEDVINHGTGAGVRTRGFDAPAAGKTGSSHDGWFAGYTTDLICVVWVGYDTDRELPLTGAASALPIWTEFMKRAIQVPEYSRTLEPVPPAGVARVEIDPETGELATPHCPTTQTEYFLEGTQTGQYCHLHYLQPVPRAISIPSIANIPPEGMVEPVAAPVPPAPAPVATTTVPVPVAKPAPAPEPEKKKGFWGRILGVFTNDSRPDNAGSP
ncbi:MAG: PBP1A family penicillin-binding protein [Acidobacteria bacterium]|nr:PBP1A family penicillin-binding protein [Acidobacteriota bacterium]